MNDESRPRAAPETTGEKSETSIALDDLDLMHSCWIAGYDCGYAAGQRLAAEHLAHELLARQAAEVAGVAVDTARRRHGDGWAEEIRRQSEVA